MIANPDKDTEKMAYLVDMNKDKFNKKFPKTMKGVVPPAKTEIPPAGYLFVRSPSFLWWQFLRYNRGIWFHIVLWKTYVRSGIWLNYSSSPPVPLLFLP